MCKTDFSISSIPSTGKNVIAQTDEKDSALYIRYIMRSHGAI